MYLEEQELKYLTDIVFSITYKGVNYKPNLNYLPFKLIEDWLKQIKKDTPKKLMVYQWYKLAQKYYELAKLIDINYELLPVRNFYKVLTKVKGNKQQVIDQLSLFTSDLFEDDYIDRFIYLAIENKYIDKNPIDIFQGLNKLTHSDIDYFWGLFYYLAKEEVNVKQRGNFKLLKRGINSWKLLFEEYKPNTLQDSLYTLFNFKGNEYIIKCIVGEETLHEVRFTPVNTVSDCEKVLGIPLHTPVKKAKSMYLQLIKRNHPDLHPESIDYYTKKTAELNEAWERWQELTL